MNGNSEAAVGQQERCMAGCSECAEPPWPRGTSYVTTVLFSAPAMLGTYALFKKAPLRLPILGAIWTAIVTVVRKVVCCRCEYYGNDCSTLMGRWTAMLYEKDEAQPLTGEAFYLDFGLIAAAFLFPLPQVLEMGMRYLALYLAVAAAGAAGIRHFGCRYCTNTVCFMNPDFGS